MTSLTDFLLARIAEDEAVARAAQAHERALLAVKPTWSVVYAWAMMLNTPNGRGGGSHNFQPGAPSPARVLAECAAKRAIVEEHGELYWFSGARGSEPTGKCRICAENEESDYEGAPLVAWPCPTLRALASIWADHPAYEAEWRLS